MRDSVLELVTLGAMPRMCEARDEQIEQFEWAVSQLQQPLSVDELQALVQCFPVDTDEDLYGIAWTLLHAVEASPNWIQVIPSLRPNGGWTVRLLARYSRWKVRMEGGSVEK